MVVYNLSINNGIQEFYSLKAFKDAFKKDKHLFEFLECEEYLFYCKQNEKSRIDGRVFPIKNGEVKLIADSTNYMVDGAYGN